MYNLVLVALFIFIYILVFLVFRKETSKNRTNRLIKRNMEYNIDGRNYKVPDLPVKGTAFLLEEDFIILMREMYIRVNHAFKECNIKFWI